jgi:hypothetical protein
LQDDLRSAVAQVQSLIDTTALPAEMATLAKFNVWGAQELLTQSEQSAATAQQVHRANQNKARAATDAAYAVAVRSVQNAA